MKVLKNTRVGTRILLVILAIAVVLGVASWRGLWGVVSIADRVGAINEAESWVGASVSRIRSGRLEQELEVEKTILQLKTGSASGEQLDLLRDSRRRFARLSGVIEAEFDRAVAVSGRLAEGGFESEIDALYSELLRRTLAARESQQSYVRNVDSALRMIIGGNLEAGLNRLEAAGASDSRIESLYAVAQKVAQEARELAHGYTQARNRVLFEVMVIYLLACGLALGFGLYLRSTILVPLRSVTRMADRLAGGDRTVDVEALKKTTSNDESGQLLRAMAKTVIAVRETEDLLARERRFAETIVETAPLPLIVASGDLEVRVANEAYCSTFNVRRDEVEGKKLFELDEGLWERDEVREPLMKVVRGEESYATVDVRHEFARFGDRTFMLNARRVWRRRGLDENLILINLLDNTDRAHAQDELIRARELALEASEAKSRFLANMSHEIRTPLNAIIGMADLLAGTDLSQEQKRYVRIFERAGNTLLNLINDILDLSKVEIGELRIDRIPVDLLQLLESACELVALKAHEKGLELTLDVDPDVPDRVFADPARIRQVLLNLLGNAIKFTEHGEVMVRVMVKRALADGTFLIRFEVKDTGIGIAGDKLMDIFESFRQGDASTTRRYGGTGLGLAISKALVEKMDGRVDVRSREGMGTVFGFEVPLDQAPGEESGQTETQAAEAGRFKGMSVLVGASSTSTRTVLRRILDFWGVSVAEASTLNELFARAEMKREGISAFDFILVDSALVMGEEAEGDVAATRLSDLRSKGGAKIFLLVAEEGFRGTDALKRGHIDGFIPKPVKRGELLEILSEFSAAETVTDGSDEHRGSVAPKLRAPVPYRVLVAEDAPDNQIVVSAYLKDEPIELDIVENGKDALDRFMSAEFGYDLVLMDIEMPVMDGYRATREIRQWEISKGLERTPIVALTAYAMKREREMCLRSGCSDYLAKPLKKMTLVNKVAAILSSRLPKAVAGIGESSGEAVVMTHESEGSEPTRKRRHLTETEVEPELLDLVPGYLENRRKDVTALEAALNSRDFVVIERIGHRMKGNGPTYGFTTLGRIGLTLEKAAAKQDEGLIRNSIFEMRSFLDERHTG